MSSGKINDAYQIVASGEALSVVSKWLGVNSFQDALAADQLQYSSKIEELRPPLLGLGADPRKYHKALATASKLERKLGQRIKGQQDEQLSMFGMKHSSGTNAGEKLADKGEREVDEDEEEGRAGAIQTKKRPLQQDLILQHNKGKKKKKKKKDI